MGMTLVITLLTSKWELPKLYERAPVLWWTGLALAINEEKLGSGRNCDLLIEKLPVLYMELPKINKWHWELKYECNYYTQVQEK